MNTISENWTRLLINRQFSYLPEEQQERKLIQMLEIQEKLLDLAGIKNGDTVLEIGAGSCMLSFGVYNIIGDQGKIIISDRTEEHIKDCREFACDQNISRELMEFKIIDANRIDLPDNSVNIVLIKSVLAHIKDKLIPFKEINRIIKPMGRLCFYEPVVSSYTRHYQLVDISKLDISDKVIEAEEKIWNDSSNSFTNFDEYSIKNNLREAGFSSIMIKPEYKNTEYTIKDNMIEQWLTTPPAADTVSLRESLLKYLTEEEYERYKKFLIINTLNKTVNIQTKSIYCLAVKM